MLENALSDTASWQTKKVEQLYKVSSPCLDDHQFKLEELESVGGLTEVCSHIVLKCLYLARIGRPDILWSVNKLARSVTKWTRACDQRLARLTSYIHHTSDQRQYCHVGNTARHCGLGLFQDSDFAGDLEDSKSTSGRVSCIFGSRTFVPISWMCKKPTSVSHSSTESEIISLRSPKPKLQLTKKKQKVDQLSDVDYVPTYTHSSQGESQLYIFEDNEAVIEMIIKSRSPPIRHVSRTHRVALDWLFDRINEEPKIKTKYVDTNTQNRDSNSTH